MRNFFLVLIITTVLGFLIGMIFLDLPAITQLQNSGSNNLEVVIQNQTIGPVWANPIKFIIRGSIASGVSAKTISLLLLLTVVTAFIAGIRHLVGLQSFGIFLPAALSVVFVVIGPIIGVGLFLLIIGIATFVRFSLSKAKIRLQYLPRMAFILWGVIVCVLIVLFLAPIFGGIDFGNVSVLPLFILILLAEDFIRVQLGKSVKAAVNLTTETLILAFASYLILTFAPFEQFALLNPEILLISVAVFDFILGKYIGLRFLEYWRFRKLINS
jgi:hypothetical protein